MYKKFEFDGLTFGEVVLHVIAPLEITEYFITLDHIQSKLKEIAERNTKITIILK